MTQYRARHVLGAFAIVLILLQVVSLGVSGFPFKQSQSVLAIVPGNSAFDRTWARTDKPVADGQTVRTWMWGPKANTGVLHEQYFESSNGMRDVQYFDKSRMEITHPERNEDDIWYVTNGLLVVELVSGNMQVGDTMFADHDPAHVNVAGDPDDVLGPTYATFGLLRSLPTLPDGSPVTQRLGRDGTIANDSSLARYGVAAAQRVTLPGLDHQIASVFLDFMRSTGTVYVDGQFTTDRLFETDSYATGLPIAEAYWASVKLQGVVQDVLIQCFERRCLTYTPSNDPAWQVEAGNVGQHYYTWRTSALSRSTPTVTSTATSTIAFGETPTNTATTSNTPTATNTAPSASTPTNTLESGSPPTITPRATNTPIYTATATNTPRVTSTATSTYTPTNTPTGESFPDGLWNVGEDITPGTYQNSDSGAGCLWQRRRDLTDNGVLAENFSHQRQRVTIRASDRYFYSEGCGTWTQLPPTPTPTQGTGGGTACLNATEATFLTLINDYRADNGLAPLTASYKLSIAANNHSLDMGQRGYFAHNSPDGESPIDRISEAGYTDYTTWAENIAAGYQTAQAVFEGWRNSSGHNQNMLDPDFTQIGIGFVTVSDSPYTYYWTTDFANGNDGSGC